MKKLLLIFALLPALAFGQAIIRGPVTSITRFPSTVCAVGSINAICICGGEVHTDGYCCYGGWSATSCPAAPSIASFSADPSSIAAGASSSLSWSVTGEDALSISGVGDVTGQSSVTVFPSTTTEYTLTATNLGGLDSAQTTVTVTPLLADPTYDPGSGTYFVAQSVAVSCASGATACYTTNDSDPAASTPGTCSAGTTYSGPIAVSVTENIRSLCTQTGHLNSSIAQASYTISTGGSGSYISPEVAYSTARSTCSSMAVRSTGTVHYFCDCQTGSQAGCAAGVDTNSGLDTDHPKQTYGAALTAFNALSAGDTVALCKGGAWTVTGNQAAIANASCAAGADITSPSNTSTCDLRDYQASWGGTNKPLVQLTGTGAGRLLNRQGGSTNGVRILNLAFKGGGTGPASGTYPAQWGYISGIESSIVDSDWMFCDNDFSYLRIGMHVANSIGSSATNFLVKGNYFNMLDQDAILGFGAGSGNVIEANLIDNTGGFVAGAPWGNASHAIYLTPLDNTGTAVATSLTVRDNQLLRTQATSTPPGPALTGILVSHGQFDGLLVENNKIDAGSGALTIGIDFRAANSDHTYFRNMAIRGNWLNVGSGLGISVGQAPGVAIDNNVITLDGSFSWKQGIWSPHDAARTGQDDVQNNTHIRNNTIYFAGSVAGGPHGIYSSAEGTGHVIASNTVTSSGGYCFATLLGTCSVGGTPCQINNDIGDMFTQSCSGTCNPNSSAYTFVGSNACYGGAVFYRNAPGSDFDSGTQITTDPLFTSPPSDFTLATGSPLIDAGSTTYSTSIDQYGYTRDANPDIGAFENGATGGGSPTTYNMAVTLAGTGSGSVTSSPTGIDCGTTCDYAFDVDTEVTLSATPTGSDTFAGWSGDCTGTGTCILTMSAARDVTATFTAAGGGGVSDDFTGTAGTALATHDSNWADLNTSAGWVVADAELDGSGNVRATGNWSQFGARYTTSSADSASITVKAKGTPASDSQVGLVLRANGTNYYVIRLTGSDGTNYTSINVFRYTTADGSETYVTSASYTGSLTADHVLRAEVSGTGATVTIVADVDATNYVNFGDTDANRITASGSPGIYAYPFGNQNNSLIDNFVSPNTGL